MAEVNAWVEAARPRTLPAAVSPVLVGAGLAEGDGSFRWDAFVAALIGATAIQVAANFANDVSDAARGADTPERVGPPRMVAEGVISRRAMWTAVWVTLAVAILAGLWLIAIAGWLVAVIGVASIAALLTYVGGPVPYGYRGFGEAAVFVFFGLVATVGARYVHDRTAPLEAWMLGAVMGFLAAAILVANNLRDIETDAAAGKRTLAVLLGAPRTRTVYGTLIGAAYLTILVGAVTGWAPPLTGLAVLTAPLAGPLLKRVRVAQSPEALIPALAGTARLQLTVGVVLAITAMVS